MQILKLDYQTGEVLDSYKSVKEAAEKNDCSTSLIRNACIYTFKGTSGVGFRWFAMNEKTGLNYYSFGNYFSADKERNLTLDEANAAVRNRREKLQRDREYNIERRPRKMTLKCDKCGLTAVLNPVAETDDLRERERFDIKINNNQVEVVCCCCETAIVLK